MGIKNIFSKVFILICTMFFCALSGFAIEVSTYNGLSHAVNTINNHPEGDTTIVLTGDIKFNSTADTLIISTNTTLTSALDATHTIKGNHNTNHFFTFQGSSSSTISNINFSNSTAGNSAIVINIEATEAGQNYSTFTIDNVTFKDNSNSGTDGGALNINSEQYTYISSTTFQNNSANAGSGGALYFQGNIGFTGDNITAKDNAAQNGGAIYASTATLTNSIFSNNTAGQNGGAIYVSTITLTGSKFTNNKATSGNGGALYITDSAKIKSTSFSGNTATNGNGDAIYNDGFWTTVQGGSFKNNKAINGGAVYTSDIMHFNRTNFLQNSASGNGGAIYVNDTITVTINGTSNLSNNTATGNGGAIYVNNASLGLNTLGGIISFQGNTDSSGDNDIYLNGSSIMSIESDINEGGTVNFYGGIKGSGSHVVAMGTTINWYAANGFDGTFNINGGALNIPNSTSNFHNVTLNNAVLNLQGDNFINNFSADSLTLTGEVPLFIDVNLANGTADIISASVSGSGNFTINNDTQLNIFGDNSGITTFDNITSGALNIDQSIRFSGSVYEYNIEQISGGFNLIRTDQLNPTVSALPVAANSKVVANVNTVNSLYNRIDVMISREYLEYQEARTGLRSNPYVRMLEDEINNVSNQFSKDEWQKMIWFIPNGGYQKVNYGNDVQDVKNTFYGGLIGVDYPYWMSDTSAFIPTVFAGYLGSSQKYSDTKLNNNSLALGGMLTYMKNFAILSAQAYITNGTETYSFRNYDGDFDVFSFTASAKGEFNMNISDDIVMQPAVTVIYNLSNLQNYTTANHAQINSTRFHNWLLTPSVKFMIDADGWYPYAGISYNFSQKQKGSVTANDFALAKYKLKNYGEVSVGIENTFLKTYSGYAQISTYLGNSKGVSLQMGFRGYFN